MKLRTKKHRWGCLLTAFSMALDTDEETLVGLVGHDGSEKINEFPDPYCRRGFHPQEFIQAAWRLGYSVTPVERLPSSKYVTHTQTIDQHEWFQEAVRSTTGVITGITKQAGHAVAYDRGRIYDPDGFEYDLGGERFTAQCAWITERRMVSADSGGGRGGD